MPKTCVRCDKLLKSRLNCNPEICPKIPRMQVHHWCSKTNEQETVFRRPVVFEDQRAKSRPIIFSMDSFKSVARYIMASGSDIQNGRRKRGTMRTRKSGDLIHRITSRITKIYEKREMEKSPALGLTKTPSTLQPKRRSRTITFPFPDMLRYKPEYFLFPRNSLERFDHLDLDGHLNRLLLLGCKGKNISKCSDNFERRMIDIPMRMLAL